MDRQVQLGIQDLGSAARTEQRRGRDAAEAIGLQLRAQERCLGLAMGIQGDIAPPLQAAEAVPLGLAMAHEMKGPMGQHVGNPETGRTGPTWLSLSGFATQPSASFAQARLDPLARSATVGPCLGDFIPPFRRAYS